MRAGRESARAWSSARGRSRLPTWSARNGGSVRASMGVELSALSPSASAREPAAGVERIVIGSSRLCMLPNIQFVVQPGRGPTVASQGKTETVYRELRSQIESWDSARGRG